MVVYQLSFFRSKSERVRQRHLVGNNGLIIENKAVFRYVGFNVNGSNDGTSKNP